MQQQVGSKARKNLKLCVNSVLFDALQNIYIDTKNIFLLNPEIDTNVVVRSISKKISSVSKLQRTVIDKKLLTYFSFQYIVTLKP